LGQLDSGLGQLDFGLDQLDSGLDQLDSGLGASPYVLESQGLGGFFLTCV
jgi:X-X-X-Leu-X-X-Gly heptad repeat protein